MEAEKVKKADEEEKLKAEKVEEAEKLKEDNFSILFLMKL